MSDIVGIADLRLAVRVDADRASRARVGEVMAPPLFVPSAMPLDDLLVELRERIPLAVVIDEYGGMAGVVSLEDLVEELVGDVRDEHDVDELPVRERADGSLLLTGMLRPDEARRLGIPVPDGAYETLAGYVSARLRRLPDAGDSVQLDGWTITVTSLDGLRVDRVSASRARGAADG